MVSSIQSYTLNDDAEEFEKSLHDDIKRHLIISYERKKLGYEIITKNGTPLRILQLTDFIPTLEDGVKKRLHTKKRAGYCHWDSIHLSRNLENPNKIVSGFCTMASKNMPFPHSWVELEHQGKEFVLDFTMNLVMEKQGYYNLYNPQKTIKIENTTLIEDLKLRERTSFEDEDIRMYLFFEARELMLEETKQHKHYITGEFPWIITEI